MARINLLPWREEYRNEKKKEFISQLVMVCLLAGSAAMLWVYSIDKSIAHQKKRNELIQTQITELESKVKEIKELKKRREDLIARMKVIQDLQGTRPTIVRYFDELVRAVPNGLFFTSMTRKGDLISIRGLTESSNRVSSFMRNIDESPWFTAPNLRSIVADSRYGDQGSNFSLDFKVALPEEEQGAGGNK